MRRKGKIWIFNGFNGTHKLFISKFITRLRRNRMNRENLIAGLLKKFDEFKADNFVDRLRVQKLVFLMQTILKYNLQYPHTLYIHGPYSPKLSDIFYEIKDTSNFNKIKFKDEHREAKFEEFVSIVKKFSDDRLLLELIATLAYIDNILGIHDEEKMQLKLKDIKPFYLKKVYDDAFKYYKQLIEIKVKET